MVVEAYPMATVKSDVVAVALFASVTLTDTVNDVAAAGVPEIVPVDVLNANGDGKVPVNAYVSEARPPEPATANENALLAVPVKPVVGVAIVSAPATANVAEVEVEDVETPLLMVLVTMTA